MKTRAVDASRISAHQATSAKHGATRTISDEGAKWGDLTTHPTAMATPPFSSTTDFAHPAQIVSSVSSTCVGRISSLTHSAIGAG